VQRIVVSRCLNKSSRLTEMLVYLSDRVLDEDATDIHELEVGSQVFGRPPYYDTGADNIVRVHASMLRKRLREYFLSEGLHETVVIDIPRGNYAPVFQTRSSSTYSLPEASLPEPSGEASRLQQPGSPASAAALSSPHRTTWFLWIPATLALVFAVLFGVFLVRTLRRDSGAVASAQTTAPLARLFWSQIFRPNDSAQIVLDDAAVDFYQVATAHPVPLSEYFDRSYLRTVRQNASAAKLDPDLIESFILRRQSSYADTSLLWKFAQTAGMLKSNAEIRFARDLTFSQMKTGNVILLGNRQSNPWIQLFESNLSLRWRSDPARNIYYPEDELSSAADREHFKANAEAGKTHEGYATISFLPNLTGTGNVLIITGTGGTAVAAAVDFLSEERAIKDLHTKLNRGKNAELPPFEALLKIEKGAGLPRDTTIITCRALPLANSYTSPVAQNSSPSAGTN